MPALVERAVKYLYSKETRSSFAIERITPSVARSERFMSVLEQAGQEEFLRKQKLIELQNEIVDSRFRESDYRKTQNYVGEAVGLQRQRIHFACPKPEDLADLIDGLEAAHLRMERGKVSAVVHAAAIAYGFVFLHPFEDGNGRIHRFLVHNILARREFTPPGLIVPVSAAMLENSSDYDASLEAFSRRLMPLVDYNLDEISRMTVRNDTAIWYRYIDMTPQAEALFRFIKRAIDTELTDELAFLKNYDAAKNSIKDIVDMPDRQIDLFIRFCLQNSGRLSKRKHASHFDFLTNEEISAMEQATQSAYGDTAAYHS